MFKALKYWLCGEILFVPLKKYWIPFFKKIYRTKVDSMENIEHKRQVKETHFIRIWMSNVIEYDERSAKLNVNDSFC